MGPPSSEIIEFQEEKQFNLGFQYHRVDIFIEPNICLEADGDFIHRNPRPYLRPHKSSKIQPNGFFSPKVSAPYDEN